MSSNDQRHSCAPLAGYRFVVPFRVLLLGAILCTLALTTAVHATESVSNPSEQEGAESVLPTVNVTAAGVSDGPTEETGAYVVPAAETATRLNLSPRETPQAMSVVTRKQMEDFRLTDVNEVLESTTGVTVEKVETDRTYYTARGFDITNFQFDGIPAPLPYGVIGGDIDTAVFDRVEVVRGATGLISGTGDPSATVNFVRKRPTQDLRATLDLTGGQWDNYRVDADVSGALTDRVRGRLVVSFQDSGSYLDRYEYQKAVLYGILEADLGSRTTVSLGHTLQYKDADSPLWGALPLYFTDGTPTDYSRSTSTATDWSFWDNERNMTFLEVDHRFGKGWQAKAILSHNDFTEDAKLFYVYGKPDRTTPGSDLFAYPSLYEADTRQWIGDLYATGPISLFGRTHQLMAGVRWSESKLTDESNYGQGIGTEIPHLEDWGGRYPEPEFTAGTGGSDFTEEQVSLYAAGRFEITDRLAAVIGGRLSDIESEGESYGVSRETSHSGVLTPYGGLVYDMTESHSIYASYSQIFKPQTEVDIHRDRLDPVEGSTYEAGIKSEFFNGQFHSAFSVFRTEQDNVAEAAGTIHDSADPYFREIDGMTSKGFEVDLSGEPIRGLQLFAGYTYLDIEDGDGNRTRTFIPRHLVRTMAEYRLSFLPQLSVGAQVNWQDDTHVEVGEIQVEQEAYALVNLMAKYRFTDNVSASVHVNNVTNEKYLASLFWAGSVGQGFYGAPTNAGLTLSWNY